ncbi:MAG TPA: tetratricopeptide repeat protein, partial [Caulobacteraceae bacterium]|nr:tetratricopeptide repeat protein [Caulobacteraceae bacterium]
MAEVLEPESGSEPDLGVESISPSAAMAIGVRKGRGRERADPEFDAFLRDQRRLISLQTEHLHEQRQVMLLRMKLGSWKDRVTLALQGLTAVVGLAVAAAVAAMAWQAHEDHGLSIAPFSVPPDFAARGLTGQVVAARVLDRLSELQNQTRSVRPASTYADDWGDDIKVEIPETGVSIGELNRYLREWLGQETRISGEVVRTPTGLSVTARAGTQPGKSFPGSEADIDALINQAAEGVYASTQPYRYAVYLTSHGRAAEGLAAIQGLARHGPAEDQPWAYSEWSSALLQRGDFEGAADVVREGQRRGLRLYDSGALNNLSIAENALSRFDGLAVARQVRAELNRTGRGFDRLPREAALRNIEGVIDTRLGDFRSATALFGQHPDLEIEGREGAVQVTSMLARDFISDHDVSTGLRLSSPSSAGVLSGLGLSFVTDADRMRAAVALGDWPQLVALGEKVFAAGAADPRTRQVAFRDAAAGLVLGYAHVGRLADAQAMLDKAPLDCEDCLWVRGAVAEMAGDSAAADRWFADLDRADPDPPMWDAEWGAALLARGDADAAIAKLEAAHRKGPHFADPLETWGEALMAKGDYAGAVSKFADADKDAPRWGRNHLMWGEALMLSGRYREARGQFEAAAGMDLSR